MKKSTLQTPKKKIDEEKFVDVSLDSPKTRSPKDLTPLKKHFNPNPEKIKKQKWMDRSFSTPIKNSKYFIF